MILLCQKFTILLLLAAFRYFSGTSDAAAAVSTNRSGNNSKILMILLDGFRWNYFDKVAQNELPGFNRLRSEGSTARRLIPEFPSLSFVNYYSLTTGLHPESHGMVDNYMWDPKEDKEFLIGENSDQYSSFWWNDGEPVWITAKKQGKSSYFWYWCGCEVEVRGHRPNYCQEYLSSPDPSFDNFTRALDNAIAVLQNGSADIAGVYFEHVDSTGHKYGPNSDELRAVIRQVDAQLDRIQTVMETTRLNEQKTGSSMFDHVNIVVFSDHGMKERLGGVSDNTSAAIRLLDYVNRTDYKRVMGSKSGPVLQLWPNHGDEDWLYSRLVKAHPNLTVYKKADIPTRYHLKQHYRVPPIYLVADPGYAIISPNGIGLSVGYHGYDNSLTDMHGIFIARGPDFKKNGRIEALPNIDIYALLCDVLDIKASPNNGSWSPGCQLLSDDKACERNGGNSIAGHSHSYVRDVAQFGFTLMLSRFSLFR